jgi:hypothetical protein
MHWGKALDILRVSIATSLKLGLHVPAQKKRRILVYMYNKPINVHIIQAWRSSQSSTAIAEHSDRSSHPTSLMVTVKYCCRSPNTKLHEVEA